MVTLDEVVTAARNLPKLGMIASLVPAANAVERRYSRLALEYARQEGHMIPSAKYRNGHAHKSKR